MPDDRIYDAVNLFKYSDIVRGTADVPGDDHYRRCIAKMAGDVLSKLWRLWSIDEVGFSDFAGRPLNGETVVDRPGRDVLIHSDYEPPSQAAAFASDAGQARLAATSCVLVHEALHHQHPSNCYVEQEILCRTIQTWYFRSLMRGIPYTSRLAGRHCTARCLNSAPGFDGYRNRLDRALSGQLIDGMINNVEYRRDLRDEATARFIARSLPWWGGLGNRWPSTRGYYLQCLAAQPDDYTAQILEVLESFDRLEWSQARGCVGGIDRLRDALKHGFRGQDVQFARRVEDVEDVIAENLSTQRHDRY